MENHRINSEKMMELQKEIEQWKKQYPAGIMLVSLNEDPFDGIFKVPAMEHMKMANTHKDEMDKNKQLCLECVLHPKPEIFLKILEEKSGIVVPIATRLVEAAGVLQEATVKKL